MWQKMAAWRSEACISDDAVALRRSAMQSTSDLYDPCRAASGACKAPREAAPIRCMDVPVSCTGERGSQLPAECSRGCFRGWQWCRPP